MQGHPKLRTWVRLCTCVHVRVYICASEHVSVCACLHVCMFTCVRVCAVNARAGERIRSVPASAHASVHVCMCAYCLRVL